MYCVQPVKFEEFGRVANITLSNIICRYVSLLSLCTTHTHTHTHSFHKGNITEKIKQAKNTVLVMANHDFYYISEDV